MHKTLIEHYKVINTLVSDYNFDGVWLENMMPYELDLHSKLIIKNIEKKKELEQQRRQGL